jgi:hypothetical protein
MSWRRMRLAVFWVCIECLLCSSEKFAHSTLRKEHEGWERVPREEQMFLAAVAAWGTDLMVAGIELDW